MSRNCASCGRSFRRVGDLARELEMTMGCDPAVRSLTLAQGMYFAATGIWPLVHMRSFEAVTGPKVDKWLVRTGCVSVGRGGGVLVSAAARRRVTAETAGLAIGSAAGLGLIDTIYSAKG